ncbi:MAG: fibronectin type III domain-containing protein [Candidatus Diapherotrites archaeon]
MRGKKVFLVLFFTALLLAIASADTYRITITPQAAVPDITPPVISSVASSSVDRNSAVITWATNESSDSNVLYGKTSANKNQSKYSLTMVLSHSVSLTLLDANTTYYYAVKSCDANHNCATSSESTFKTTSCSVGRILCGSTCVLPACNVNSDCPSDNNSTTTEVCNNPGTCTASCASVPLQACPSGTAISAPCRCGSTIISSGLCCSGTPKIPCTNASECNDNDVCTNDSCLNPGTCSAACTNATVPNCVPPPVCGDGTCSGGETCSSCSNDCGGCPATQVCGDGSCSGTEDCSSCSSDCGSCGTGPGGSPGSSTGTVARCGNGLCERGGGENTLNCLIDCGNQNVLAQMDSDNDGSTADKDCDDKNPAVKECTGCMICKKNACVETAACGNISLDDSDGDGLTNAREAELGTNPNEIDSDKDTVSDGQEGQDGTDPLDETSNLVRVHAFGIIDVNAVQQITLSHPKTGNVRGFYVDIISPSGRIFHLQAEDDTISFTVSEPGKYIVKAYKEGLKDETTFTVKKEGEVVLPGLPGQPQTIAPWWLFVLPVISAAVSAAILYGYLVRRKRLAGQG